MPYNAIFIDACEVTHVDYRLYTWCDCKTFTV